MKSVTRVISFTSGKGGTGKTTSVVNIATALTELGRSVMIFDADLGLANVDVMLGIRPQRTIHDVLEGRVRLEEVILNAPGGLRIIPAASGVSSLCALSARQRLSLTQQIEQVAEGVDYLLIDTQAGIGADVMYFNGAAAEVVCVMTPDPTSMTDAYALVKVLSQEYGERAVSVLMNNVPTADVQIRTAELTAYEKIGQQAFQRFGNAVARFLHVELDCLGCVPADRMVGESIRAQKPLLELFPSSPAARAVRRVACRIDQAFLDHRVKGGMQFFFQQLLEMNEHGYSGA
ncbi:MAG: MinD/ParA family protein [Bdellovibrionota bacterium]|nr:MAG: MinD/ParA family protein [Bdellovibrionota bacterium]